MYECMILYLMTSLTAAAPSGGHVGHLEPLLVLDVVAFDAAYGLGGLTTDHQQHLHVQQEYTHRYFAEKRELNQSTDKLGINYK